MTISASQYIATPIQFRLVFQPFPPPSHVRKQGYTLIDIPRAHFKIVFQRERISAGIEGRK